MNKLVKIFDTIYFVLCSIRCQNHFSLGKVSSYLYTNDLHQVLVEPERQPRFHDYASVDLLLDVLDLLFNVLGTSQVVVLPELQFC